VARQTQQKKRRFQKTKADSREQRAKKLKWDTKAGHSKDKHRKRKVTTTSNFLGKEDWGKGARTINVEKEG